MIIITIIIIIINYYFHYHNCFTGLIDLFDKPKKKLKPSYSLLYVRNYNKIKNEPCYEKSNILHMRKQRPRSASGNREADQCLSFCYRDSSIHLLSNPEISSLYSSSVDVQPGLCRTM